MGFGSSYSMILYILDFKLVPLSNKRMINPLEILSWETCEDTFLSAPVLRPGMEPVPSQECLNNTGGEKRKPVLAEIP